MTILAGDEQAPRSLASDHLPPAYMEVDRLTLRCGTPEVKLPLPYHFVTPESEQVARQLAVTDGDGRDALMAALLSDATDRLKWRGPAN